MISTGVLLTVVLASFATIGGAFYSVVVVLGQRIGALESRFDGFEARVGSRFDRLDSEVAGLKAAVAVLESRLEH